ncbi:hypothetical protein BB558_001126 [Smittium angustum]|uniref:Uncharacterized protein n=1 Tax=Smittium angustum TaxID=133377 RepID=A0A2U1JCA0_SMIAN|nr:hypothetical protein BB558_001126 [Smittium angustum]
MKETEKLFRLKIQAQNLSPVPPTSASSTIPTVPASFSALFVSSAKLNSTSTTFFSIALSEERSHDTEDEMETVMTSERMQVDSLLNPIQYQQPGFYNNPYSTNLYPPPSGPNPSVELSPHLPPINQRMGIN